MPRSESPCRRGAWLCAWLLALPGAAAQPPQRVVSLAPHLTELIYSAGGGERLVGAVDHSDWPPAARALPRIGDSVRFDLERILRLEPDLVVAWGSGTPERARAQLERLGLSVVTLEPEGLTDIAADLRELGRLLGTETTANATAARYLSDLERLRRAHAGLAPVTVFYQIQDRPLYTVNRGHVISQVIELCGGRNVFGELERLAPTVSREAVLERDPQAILAGDFGEGTELDEWRAFPELAAVRYGNLLAVDANLVSRSTTRILEGARQVCRALATARDRVQERT